MPASIDKTTRKRVVQHRLNPADKNGVGRGVVLAFKTAIEDRQGIVQHRRACRKLAPASEFETFGTIDLGYSCKPSLATLPRTNTADKN